jgi:hypothetical protein
MANVRKDAGARKKLDDVSAKLAADKMSGKQRLALLRRQAELGDERDRAVVAARRAATTR